MCIMDPDGSRPKRSLVVRYVEVHRLVKMLLRLARLASCSGLQCFKSGVAGEQLLPPKKSPRTHEGCVYLVDVKY